MYVFGIIVGLLIGVVIAWLVLSARLHANTRFWGSLSRKGQQDRRTRKEVDDFQARMDYYHRHGRMPDDQ